MNESYVECLVKAKTSVIGNGVVVNPWGLREEMKRISDLGTKISPDVLAHIEKDIKAILDEASK